MPSRASAPSEATLTPLITLTTGRRIEKELRRESAPHDNDGSSQSRHSVKYPGFFARVKMKKYAARTTRKQIDRIARY
jgi:hypothetical protein